MNNFKHSKYRNTGIIFNILAKQSIQEAMASQKPKAIKLLKKYFKKGAEIHNEFLLYKALSENMEEVDSYPLLLNVITEERRKLNEETLEKEKYKLIGEVKKNYNLSELFKTQINKYSHFANIYKIFEYKASENPKEYLKCYESIISNISKSKLNEDDQDRFSGLDIRYRKIAFKKLIEKFNEKYKNLNTRQANLIREFINSSVDSIEFKDFVIREVKYIQDALGELSSSYGNKVIQIKLNEVAKLANKIIESGTIKESYIKALMKYYQLIEIMKNEE